MPTKHYNRNQYSRKPYTGQNQKTGGNRYANRNAYKPHYSHGYGNRNTYKSYNKYSKRYNRNQGSWRPYTGQNQKTGGINKRAQSHNKYHKTHKHLDLRNMPFNKVPDKYFNVYKQGNVRKPRVLFVVTQDFTLNMVDKYKQNLCAKNSRAGTRLFKVVNRDFKDKGSDFHDRLNNMTNLELLNAILSTKSVNPPALYENAKFSKSKCKWNKEECRILSSVSVVTNVRAYDDGSRFDHNREVFSGKNYASIMNMTPVFANKTYDYDYDYVHSSNDPLNAEYNIFRSRLLPLLQVANQDVEGKIKAHVVMTTAGEFSSLKYGDRPGNSYPEARFARTFKHLNMLINENKDSLKNIDKIVIIPGTFLDDFDYKKNYDIGNIKIEISKEDEIFYIDDETPAEAKDRKLFCIAPTDPLGFPGCRSAKYNDSKDETFSSRYCTSSTDLISYLSGIPGRYDKKEHVVKPVSAKSWKDVDGLEQCLGAHMKKLVERRMINFSDSKKCKFFDCDEIEKMEKAQSANKSKMPMWGVESSFKYSSPSTFMQNSKQHAYRSRGVHNRY